MYLGVCFDGEERVKLKNDKTAKKSEKCAMRNEREKS
jgi:hypothetical protein